ncbi:MAG: branched-chain amino acid ABC transporter permease [Deltaproteobacteria bacterium]|nr:branched-chain amino acid ABC transporter permease [Deltaproteobacteria bacterium]
MDMKRDYYEDIQLLPSGVIKFWFLVLLAALAGLPFCVGNYYSYMFNYMAVNVLVAIGLNILVGYTGQVSLGHAGFFAIGAYGTTLLMTKAGLPFILALPLSGLIAAAFGFVLGLPALRLEGPYLAIATLGFGLTVTQLLGRLKFFGGHMGLQAPELILFGSLLKTDRHLYYLVMTITVIMTIGARNLIKTRVGRAFIAIRDSDVAAETIGINLTLYKTLAFAISAGYTGIAGGLMVFLVGFINPNSFNLMLSITFLAMVVVGGVGSILGSIMGGVFMSFLNLKLSAIQDLPYLGGLLMTMSEKWFSVSGLPNVANIVFGLILVLIVVFEPSGLYGFWIRAKTYWKTWPF